MVQQHLALTQYECVALALLVGAAQVLNELPKDAVEELLAVLEGELQPRRRVERTWRRAGAQR